MAKLILPYILFAAVLMIFMPSPVLAEDDLFKREGINPYSEINDGQDQASQDIVLSTDAAKSQGEISFWSFKDAILAFGDTALLVVAMIAFLAGFKALQKAFARRRVEAGQNLEAPPDAANEAMLKSAWMVNRNQKAVLVLTAIVLVGMLLFPPFHVVYKGREMKAAGYHFGLEYQNASVDRGMLSIQIATVLVIGGIGLLIFQSKRP